MFMKYKYNFPSLNPLNLHDFPWPKKELPTFSIVKFGGLVNALGNFRTIYSNKN